MSTRIIAACILWISIVTAIVLAGCSKETVPSQGAAAALTADADALPDGLRLRRDDARQRIWVLGLDDVRVYDARSKRLVRQVALPGWSVARSICYPDMVLDSSGSAIISSNAQATLWRVDGDTFELTVREIRMHEKEQWDVGFGALAFAADGALFGLTSVGGSLWRIDVGAGSAHLVRLKPSVLNVCDLTNQLLNDIEGSVKP
jgi:hypothetical protein